MSTVQQNHTRVVRLTTLGMLSALILLFAFTPIGYLKIGPLSITFLQIPVIIGAILLGPTGGAILGGVFGLTSFIQCFGIDPFGYVLLGINPFLTAITCLGPRILMGWLVGLIFRALSRVDKKKVLSFGLSGLSGALLNTILFMSLLLLFFRGYMTEAVSRNWCISTSGYGSTIIDESAMKDLSEEINEKFSVRHYASAYSGFADFCDAHISQDSESSKMAVSPSNAQQVPRLVDNADLLTDSEEETLLAQLNEISERQQFDIVAVTTDTLNEKATIQDYADDFYSRNAYGMNGALMLISVNKHVSLWTLLVAFVGVNGIVEAIVCTIVGAAIAKALTVAMRRYRLQG